MHVRVLGEVRLGSGSEKRLPPSGRVGALLRWLLLRPNQTHTPEKLISIVWPENGAVDEESAKARLHVVVSRLRSFLRSGGGAGLGVEVVTEEGGYRLSADAETLDRVAFETLARRALDGEPELAAEALSLWRGEPYSGFPLSEETERQRARLVELRHRLERLADEGWLPTIRWHVSAIHRKLGFRNRFKATRNRGALRV